MTFIIFDGNFSLPFFMIFCSSFLSCKRILKASTQQNDYHNIKINKNRLHFMLIL